MDALGNIFFEFGDQNKKLHRCLRHLKNTFRMDVFSLCQIKTKISL